MASLEALLNNDVSAFSRRRTRHKCVQDIDSALRDVKAAASRSPVKQAFKLFSSRSSSKLNAQVESRVFHDENATVLSLARDVTTGRRSLTSLQSTELLLLRRALQTRRNSLAPIWRLPTELLTQILELCPTIEADKPEFQTAKFALGLKVSHVCRRWREIAMKRPNFWAHIVLSRPRWALEMLHRSRGAPLTVGADFGGTNTGTKRIAARDLVLAQLPRIRELHVRMPVQSQALPAALLLPAPNLETLHLWSDEPADPFFASAALFQGQARLRHLSLRYCFLEGSSPLWKGIVSLELDNVALDYGMDEFLMNLSTWVPRLRALTLTQCPPNTLEASQPISLGLETLEITANPWICASLLRAFIIPKCRIVLNVPYGSPELRHVWDAIESHRIHATDPVISELKVADLPSTADGRVFEVAFFNQTNYPDLPRYIVRLVEGPTPSQPPPVWRDEVMDTILTIMSLDQVTTFTSNSATLTLSASLLHLQHFRSAAFHRFIEPFTDGIEGDPLMAVGDATRFEPFHAAVHYPRLRKLAFHHVAFNERHVGLLLDWLAQRKRLNVGIEELALVGCTLTSAELGSLREVASRTMVSDAR
ncbi:hypothetical protein C8R46DRAFT_1076072 [Mycena filopes]|nr:hypothetical protein C8R46DRAFT_1076072 [Mycena filopes]